MLKNLVEMPDTFMITPGEHIQAWLDDCGMSVIEFCKRSEISRPTYYRILKGEQPITADTARRLELVTGASAAFWSNLESNYRLAILRQKSEQLANDQKNWIKQQPVAALIAGGFLPLDFRKRSIGDQVALLCQFYNVASVDAYMNINTSYQFAARTVKGVSSTSCALTAWLQMATLLAQKSLHTLPKYSAAAFKKTLSKVRLETAKVDNGAMSAKDFLSLIKDEFSSAGVKIMCLKKVKGIKNLQGVAFWMNEHPVIVLTLHSHAFDRIVFSLYHEAAHILDEDRALIYVTDKDEGSVEHLTDEKAAEMLIASSYNNEIENTHGIKSAIIKIAGKIGVSASIVLGRYQHLRNRFGQRRDYTMPKVSWEDIGSFAFL